MPTLRELMDAAEAGARSVPTYGWYREECRQAAMFGLVQWPPRTTGEAYKRGRWDAIAELRRLTGGRTKRPLRRVPWPRNYDDEPSEVVGHGEGGMVTLEDQWDIEADRDRIRAWAAKQPARTRQAVELILEGRTAEQAAKIMGVSESRVSQLLGVSRRARSRP